MLWLYLIIILIITYLVYKYIKIKDLPGPWGLPLIGNLLQLDPKHPYKSLSKLAEKYGGIYFLRLGTVKTVVLSDTKLIRQALSKEEFSGRAPLYLTHGIMHGYGIICSEGELWKEHRRFVLSCFKSLGMVKLGERRNILGEKIQDSADECIEILMEGMSERGTVLKDISKGISHTLGNLLNALVFGHTYKRDDRIWMWLQNIQEEGTKLIGIAGALNFLPFLRFLPKYKNALFFLLDGKERTHDIYRKILLKHIRERDFHGHLAGEYLIEMLRRPEDNQGTFSEEQCLHALADMFGAGLDTTFTTLKWFFLYLSIYPNIQCRVQQELDEIVRDDDDGPKLSDMHSCPYTMAVFSEVQRLRSVVPLGIPHGALKDTELGGYKIEKGTMIIPLQWAVHTDNKIWGDDSLEFKPERFLTNDERYSRPDYFIPFQTGKRTCLGEELAYMILFIYGSKLIHKYYFELPLLPEGITTENLLDGECGITLTPKQTQFVLTLRN